MAADPELNPQSEASLQAFREALSKSITIPRERLQEIVDDAVRRGRMTRSDAEELVGRLLSRGREQADDLLKQIEPIVSQTRSEVTTRTAPARDRATDAAARARREVGTRVSKTKRRARDRADEPLARADRMRRKAGLPGFPISAYDQLSVPQINNRLRELNHRQLRKVADYESGNRNRVGVMRAIERKLEQS
ncbi:MAG: hypothetical protein ACXWDQ_04180 [Solirubrobacterales bacterium]